MMSDDMLDEDAENSACQDVDEIVIYVPEFSGYREVSHNIFDMVNIDTAISLCPTPTLARKEPPNRNLEMRRRFEKFRREKEEKRLLGDDEGKELDEEDDVFEEGEGLRMRAFEPSTSRRTGDVSMPSLLPRTAPVKKTRKHRRRRSGSFTGGVYPRKGHRNRSLLGYAIPPPNVHSGDWRDMLAITDNKDDKLMKTMQAIKDAIRKQREAEMKLLGRRKVRESVVCFL
ncbi:hypothetical protein CAEBREN_30428 [Caenorhabditis brenneri]|uniref:Uncharacterized protein n=1 Tax=Caenorhabditis brenneri TaxID=135651 RepID=G0PGW2_CAEBE|nr:hypothetical protein CAEBREN_30428 [Caenorhabditis brenneri]